MPLDFGRFPAFLQDPFVPILATFTKDGEKPVEGVISAFVIEVLGIWYLMTAGHCITVIEENRARGYKATFSLPDHLGPQKRFKQGSRRGLS